MSYALVEAVATQVYPFIKRHRTECLQRGHFITCKSHLNKQESIGEK